MEKKNLPTLQELHHDVAVAFKNDQLKLLLNQKPPDAWIKKHPFAKDVKYLPIEKHEFLLDKIFQEWRVEILSYSALFNSVAVHVRLHYKSPIDGTWSYHDGLGAVGVQTDKGESASNLSAIKQDAIMKALPAAESYAVKDAAEKLGELFGKNLNRRDTLPFSPTYMDEEQLKYEIKHASEVEVDIIWKQNPDKHKMPWFNAALNTRKKELAGGVPHVDDLLLAVSICTTVEEVDQVVARYPHIQQNINFMKRVLDKKNAINNL